jgi:hypothetical protein
MVTRRVLQIAGIVIIGLVASLFADSDPMGAQDGGPPAVEKRSPEFRRSIEDYRKAIKDAYKVDIKDFKDTLKGGYADGKPITKYDLAQLLEGIKWERQHTNDSLVALELAMDHLERIPDYYSHLTRMERQCESDKLGGM